MKPIIGIIAKHNKTKNIRTNSSIRDEIKQAIFDNGGIPIGILSPDKKIIFTKDDWEKGETRLDREKIVESISLCDGIILQGGTMSEVFEDWVARYCYNEDIPLLGICAGQNAIARGLGGNTKEVCNLKLHHNLDSEYAHEISIDKNSKFYSIVKKEKILVNSRHKKCVDKHPLLNSVGMSPDGCTEVLEAPNKTFYIGVKFHPESLYSTDENMNAIFCEFINSCKEDKDHEF